jgi:hypothetical protein
VPGLLLCLRTGHSADGEQPERSHYGEVLLAGWLPQALKHLNPRLSPDFNCCSYK